MHEELVQFHLRRVRPVVSREVDPGEAVVEPAGVPKDNVLAPLGREEAAPVLDPTQFSRRRRKTKHIWHFRITRLLIGLSMLASLVCVLLLILAERSVALWFAGGALALALAGSVLTWQTFLSARVQGYAIAATLLALLVGGASWALPASWFADHSPDTAVEPTWQRPKKRDAPAKVE